MCHFLAILGSSNWSILPVCNTNMLTFMLLPKIIHLSTLTMWVAYLDGLLPFFFFVLIFLFPFYIFFYLLYMVFFHFLLRYASDYILLYVFDHVGNGMNSPHSLSTMWAKRLFIGPKGLLGFDYFH